MPQENFAAEGDENETAGELDFVFEEMADSLAEKDTKVRQQKSYNADNYNRRSDGDLDEGQGYTDGERVDAGCHREQ